MSQVPKFLSKGLAAQHSPAFGKGNPQPSSPSWARRGKAPEASAAEAAKAEPATIEGPIAAAPLPKSPPPDAIDQRIEDRIAELGQTVELLETQAQADALEVGMLVARRLLDRELESSPLALEGLVKVALRKLGEVKKVTVRLSPRDHARLKELKGFDGQRITLIADPKLEPGDVMVETDTQTFDGRLSTRLEELEKELRTKVVDQP
jgi:flagellar assembly protein FliH